MNCASLVYSTNIVHDSDVCGRSRENFMDLGNLVT